MGRIENWLIMAMSVGLVVIFTSYFYQTTAFKHLDSVFLFESTLSIVENGQPTSATVASWPVALKTFSIPVEELCQSDWNSNELQSYNVLDNHAYVSLYAISFLTALTDPEFAFAILNSLAHVLMLVIPFIFLRKQGCGIFASFVFLMFVVSYPAWSYSAVGDYYLDRLYMPFALLSLYLMHVMVGSDGREVDRRLLAVYAVTVIVAALFTERAAIMMIGAIAFFLLFFPSVRNTSSIRNTMLALIMFLGAFLFIYFRYVYVGIEAGGGLISNIQIVLRDPLKRLQDPALSSYLLVNILFMGGFALFSGFRYLLLGIVVLIPNILITVGGAEMNGWETHYHNMYLPFLVFIGSIGFLRLAQGFNVKNRLAASLIWMSVYILLVAAFFNPIAGQFERKAYVTFKKNILGKTYMYYIKAQHSHERLAVPLREKLDGLIPQGANVSAIENAMPALYRSRNLSLYPVGMDDAEYLVISGTVSDGRIKSVSGAVSYLGQKQVESLNQCLLQRIFAKGFVLYEDIAPHSLLIFKRVENDSFSAS